MTINTSNQYAIIQKSYVVILFLIHLLYIEDNF